jgi:hypothetical protein
MTGVFDIIYSHYSIIPLGCMIGSFLLLYSILTLYGSALLYREVKDSGCDPSDTVKDNHTCESSGPGVFGAMLGIGKLDGSRDATVMCMYMMRLTYRLTD